MSVAEQVTTQSDAITEKEWGQLEDPPGQRYEVILGEVVLTPAAQDPHGFIQARLIRLFYPAIPEGTDLTPDSEWRLAKGGLVAMSPRPDLMVLAYPRALSDVPLLAVEVISDADDERLKDHPHLTRIQGKRLDYAANGLQHYLEIDPRTTTVRRFELRDGSLQPVDLVEDEETLSCDQPFKYEFSPAHLCR